MTMAVGLGRKATKQTNKQTFDFDWVGGILHDLIRACISDALVAVPFNTENHI